MIKVVFSWKDHPGLSAEECEANYRTGHMPLAREAFRGVAGFKMLRYNRVRQATVNDYNQRAARAVDSDADAWVELYFENAELMAPAFARPQMQALFDDHVNFMNCDVPANIKVYWVDEEVILAAPEVELSLKRALRSTGSVRSFKDAPVDDAALRRVLDTARFAPSGGNKQSWRVIVVRDAARRAEIHALTLDVAKEYLALSAAGQRAFGLTAGGRWPGPGEVDLAAARAGQDPTFLGGLAAAPVMLVILTELGLIAAMDAELDRHGLVAGASVYPFAWSALLAAHAEGLGGVLTTFAARQEPAILELLDAPPGHGVAAVVYLGYPQQRATKLSRHPVDEFTFVDRFGGPALG